MKNVTKFVEEIKTNFTPNIFFFENHAVYEMLKTYFTLGQVTDKNMVHAGFMLDTLGL
jgi:hypothetical protein